MSPQLKRIHRLRAEGLCVQCGNPADGDKSLCVPCGIKAREWSRAYYRKRKGIAPDQPLDSRGRRRMYAERQIPDGAITPYELRRRITQYVRDGFSGVVWDGKTLARIKIEVANATLSGGIVGNLDS